jgi:hypothetical protein
VLKIAGLCVGAVRAGRFEQQKNELAARFFVGILSL